MTLLFMDGFDHYSSADAGKKWDVATANPVISVNSPRTGLQSLLLSTSAMSVTKSIPPTNTVIVGMGLLKTDAVTHAGIISLLGVDGNPQVSMGVIGSSGLLEVRRGSITAGTILGTSSAGVSSTWKYVEFKAFIHDTLGTIEIRIDGVTVLSLTNQDTKEHATSDLISTVRIGRGSSGSTEVNRIDDLYICDANGTINNDFLGDIKIETLFPFAEGATTEFTPSSGTDNALLVDDPLANTTDYVTSTTPDQIDLYTLGNLSSAGGTIKGIQADVYAQKTDTGIQNVEPILRTGGVNYPQGERAISFGSLRFYTDIAELNPATGVAWTVADINALEAGFASRT